jgi:hypothetical protein
MKSSKHPLWKESMLDSLSLDDINQWLSEIMDNGDMYGYDRPDETGYYQEYKPLFDDLSAYAYGLYEALQDSDIEAYWDDMTVAMLGETHKVLGFDVAEADYFGMLSDEEDLATEEAAKRLERLPKRDLIRCFRKVIVTLVSFLDIKAGHDCLTAIVDELDERSALLRQKNDAINRLYQDLTGADGEEFDRLISNIPQRMWAE